MIRNKNEKLQERVEQNDIYETNKETNLKLGAQVERYKEVSLYFMFKSIYMKLPFLILI